MTQVSDLAAELDAEINDLAAAVSATSNPNPLVTEVLDRMRATSFKLANAGGYFLDPLDDEPEPAPASQQQTAPKPTPDTEQKGSGSQPASVGNPFVAAGVKPTQSQPAPDLRASRL